MSNKDNVVVILAMTFVLRTTVMTRRTWLRLGHDGHRSPLPIWRTRNQRYTAGRKDYHLQHNPREKELEKIDRGQTFLFDPYAGIFQVKLVRKSQTSSFLVDRDSVGQVWLFLLLQTLFCSVDDGLFTQYQFNNTTNI